jgi:hypothetical protein
MKKFFISAFVVLTGSLGLTYFTPTPFVSAGTCDTRGDPNFLDFPRWNRGLDCTTTTLSNGKTIIHTEIGTGKDGIPTFIWTVVLNVFDILLRVAGILAVVMLIVSGYQYLTSAGVPDKISKAKNGMLRAIVGLALALLASTIIYFIVGKVV